VAPVGNATARLHCQPVLAAIGGKINKNLIFPPLEL
jgi:hypothetical protein